VLICLCGYICVYDSVSVIFLNTLAPLYSYIQQRYSCSTWNHVQCTSAVRELHWLSIAQRIDYTNYVSLCTRPHQLVAGLHHRSANIPMRSSLRAFRNGDLFLPRTNGRIGDRAFSVAAPRAWNWQPTELKLMRSSTTTFKRHFKTFLFNTWY